MRSVAFILLWLYVFTLPWDYILQFGDQLGSASRVAGLLALAGFATLVIATARVRSLRAVHVAVAVYLAIVTASLFWTTDFEGTQHSIRTYAQSVAVVWMTWEVADSQRKLFHIVTAYVAGASVAALCVLHNFSTATVDVMANEARFAPDNWDANDIALALSLGIPLAFYIANRRTHWMSTGLGLGYLVLGPIAIVLTSSRGGIVVMAIAFSALPLFLRTQTATAKAMTAITIVCAVFVAWHYAPQQSWDRLLTVLDSLRTGDLNSRETIWQDGLRVFGSNCLVGVGAGGFQSGVGIALNAHNTFLAVLVEQGVAGFTVFSAILGWTIRSAMRNTGNDRKMCVLLLLCWAVGVFTLGWASNRITWFVLGLVISLGGARESRPHSASEGQHRLRALAGAAL